MDGRPTWTDCDEAGDYVVPNVLSPRDLVSRPDNMDETVPHTRNLCSMVLPEDMELYHQITLCHFCSTLNVKQDVLDISDHFIFKR